MLNKTKILIAVIFALISFSAFSKDLLIFIIAGQSNASGRGPIIKNNNAINTRILNFSNENIWQYASEPIDNPKNEKYLVAQDLNAGTGVGLYFAEKIQYSLKRDIGILNCAKGGSSLDDWLLGGGLFHVCIERANLAKKRGKIVGLLFIQGETEAQRKNTYSAENWDINFIKLVRKFRAYTGNSNLQVAFVPLADRKNLSREVLKNFPNWELVRKKQLNLMLNKDNIYIVSPSRYEFQKNSVHYTNRTYNEIGALYAKLICEIQPKSF